jgi:acetyl esterase/lipase
MAAIAEYLDIPYHSSTDRNKLRELDLYVPAQNDDSTGKNKPPLIVFVHGGAWAG